MKPGLRLQILLLLGVLMVLSFVPLFVAVTTYTRVTLSQLRQESSRSLGRAVAGHVLEARARRTPEELRSLLDAEIGAQGVDAIAVYGTDGIPSMRVGDPKLVDALAGPAEVKREAFFEMQGSHGRALAIAVPDARGLVVAVVRADDISSRATPLARLVGLYIGVGALALLVAAYFALTRLIVRPLDTISRAAQRVADGARKLDVPEKGAPELVELGHNLKTMTDALVAEEEALRNKVDEVEAATKRLEEAQGRLVRSERLASVGRLAAGLAHEIGNPIAALMGMQDLLLEGGLSEAEQQDFLKRMQRETERINRILRDLLQFARPGDALDSDGEGGGNVETAVYDTVALVSPQKALKDVDLAVDVHPDLPEVSLSREHLVQVILNLVLNAADACETGEGKHITLRALPQADGVRLEVEDDGPGVPESVQGKLFEPFVTTKEVGKGTGLGLAVCRGLVEAAGGSINLDPGHDGGARFVIELPSK